MKKSFPLHTANHADPRVVEAIKHQVRKYVQRERRKVLPADFDQWDFECKAGKDAASAETCALDSIGSAIDAVAQSGAEFVYVEVMARPGKRPTEQRTVLRI
jgi:hypothetical protein